MENENSIIPSQHVRGVIGCITEFTPQCYYLLINESIGLLICCIQSFYIVKRKTLTNKKQIISFIVLAAVSCHLIFNLTQSIVEFLYLQRTFIQLFNFYLSYYFGLKAVRNKINIKMYFYSALFFTNFVLVYQSIRQIEQCQSVETLIVRMVGLCNNCVFLSIIYSLNRKIKLYNSYHEMQDKQHFQFLCTLNQRLKYLKSLGIFSILFTLVQICTICSNKYYEIGELLNYVPFLFSFVIFMPAQQRVSAAVSLDIENINESYFSNLTLKN